MKNLTKKFGRSIVIAGLSLALFSCGSNSVESKSQDNTKLQKLKIEEMEKRKYSSDLRKKVFSYLENNGEYFEYQDKTNEVLTRCDKYAVEKNNYEITFSACFERHGSDIDDPNYCVYALLKLRIKDLEKNKEVLTFFDYSESQEYLEFERIDDIKFNGESILYKIHDSDLIKKSEETMDRLLGYVKEDLEKIMQEKQKKLEKEREKTAKAFDALLEKINKDNYPK